MKLLKLPRYPAGFRRPSRSSVIMQGTRATIIVGINGLTGREIKILSGDLFFSFVARIVYALRRDLEKIFESGINLRRVCERR